MLKFAPKYIILGSGSFAREVYWHLRAEVNPKNGGEILFANDFGEEVEICFGDLRVPVIKNWQFPDGFLDPKFGYRGFIIGAGLISAKRALVKAAMSAGLYPAETFVHPRALVQSVDCVLGRGGIVAPNSILTTNVRLGDYVVINPNCFVGHDSQLDDYVTCNPGCSISGNTRLASGVLVGAGAVIRQQLAVAADVTIGAQACVVEEIVKPGTTVVGVPAKRLGLSRP